MVQQHFDPCYRHAGGYPRRKDSYPKLSPETQLREWFKKTSANSVFMRTKKLKTHLQLRQKVALGLGLSSSNVTIEQREDSVVLLSTKRDSPLAELSTN
jgi:hypothetical protein